jgi:hypothetical protein
MSPSSVIQNQAYPKLLNQIRSTIESGYIEVKCAKVFVSKRSKDLFYGEGGQYLNQHLPDEGLAVGYKE